MCSGIYDGQGPPTLLVELALMTYVALPARLKTSLTGRKLELDSHCNWRSRDSQELGVLNLLMSAALGVHAPPTP